MGFNCYIQYIQLLKFLPVLNGNHSLYIGKLFMAQSCPIKHLIGCENKLTDTQIKFNGNLQCLHSFVPCVCSPFSQSWSKALLQGSSLCPPIARFFRRVLQRSCRGWDPTISLSLLSLF